MTTTEWLGIYGALVSTLLACREIWKHRRTTRPKLAAHIAASSDGPSMRVRGPNDTTERRGETYPVYVHNRGGAATTLGAIRLCVSRKWVPRWLLGTLGEFGRVPTVGDSAHELLMMRPPTRDPLDSNQEQVVNVVLWEEHREALANGRLMLRVVHTWHRDRPQQVPIRRAL